MRLYGLILYLLFICTVSLSANSGNIIQFRKLQLRRVAYPWWGELSLKVSGMAHPIYEKTTITLSLYYFTSPKGKHGPKDPKYRVQWFNCQIPQCDEYMSKIRFSGHWEPINLATQEIAPGYYQVEAKLVWNKQSLEFQKRWQQKYPGEKVPEIVIWHKRGRFQKSKKTFVIKQRQFAEVAQREKAFYLDRIKALNELFSDLRNNKEEALRVRLYELQGRRNSFAYRGKFSPEKWLAWKDKYFWSKLQAEEDLLLRHEQKIYPKRYPVTHESMKVYCSYLVRLLRKASAEIYRTYFPQNRKYSAFGTESYDVILRAIQIFHGKCARELEVDLYKILGYYPPP